MCRHRCSSNTHSSQELHAALSSQAFDFMLSEEHEGPLTVGLYPKTLVPTLTLQVADFSFLPERTQGQVFKVVQEKEVAYRLEFLLSSPLWPVPNATVSLIPI